MEPLILQCCYVKKPAFKEYSVALSYSILFSGIMTKAVEWLLFLDGELVIVTS